MGIDRMALIYEPRVFAGLARVRAALSLRGRSRPPYGFNMSLSVGDDPEVVMANRARLARRLGFEPSWLTLQRQVHADDVVVVGEGYEPGETDAMMTDEEGWLLAVSVADCAPVLLYDEEHHAVAAIHSGWRGSERNITGRTIARMRERYGTDPARLRAYVGAAAGQCCYEVGEDVASRFDARYSRPIGSLKYLFDNKGRVLDQLLESRVDAGLVELDERCTICSPAFHSYRRDGSRSGRMLAVIGMNTGLAAGPGLKAA
jgi:YfiH family protein